ncbi:MAG: hypothetical protein WC256_12715 [Desulfurivibrionaceae bacterium]
MFNAENMIRISNGIRFACRRNRAGQPPKWPRISASQKIFSTGGGKNKEYRAREGHAFPGYGRELMSPQEQRIKELEKKLKNAEMARDILKKAMPSSAGHRNEISIHREKPLLISGEEDVPCLGCFPERLLPFA